MHTLTWKHKHYPMKEDLEPATLPEEPEFVGDSYPSMYGSQQYLNPQVIVTALYPRLCIFSTITSISPPDSCG